MFTKASACIYSRRNEKKLLTVAIDKGLFQYQRLPNGVASASTQLKNH